jgi:branched-chain amino acid transport system permease protein
MAQAATMMLLCLSYNLLLGQTGMLSFGHAVYSGLGAICTLHAINLASAGELNLPLPFMPLVGGLAGAVFGAVFGYVSTRRSGTAFAMITLGIGELVAACASMLPEFFGGEGGISANRVYGEPFMGFSFGPQIQVVYLIAFWLFLCALLMYAFTHTPLGRMANAVRDNPERAAFIGYDPQHVRYLVLVVSAFFAGVAGSLAAINFEIATAENVGLMRSGEMLLFTVIGGTAFFFGPLIGAVLGVILTGWLAMHTPAWQMYLGMVFIAVVMFMPGGLAGGIVRCRQVGATGQVPGFRVVARVLAATLLAVGTVPLIEMLYHLSHGDRALPLVLIGMKFNVGLWSAWLMPSLLAASGAMILVILRRTAARLTLHDGAGA